MLCGEWGRWLSARSPNPHNYHSFANWTANCFILFEHFLWFVSFLTKWLCCILTFDPANMPFQRRRKWHIPMASYGERSRRRAWLTIWDKVKSRVTVTDWYTGREWPVNCMTVISVWWRWNMPFQGRRKWHIPMASYGEIVSGRFNYYITRWRQEVS